MKILFPVLAANIRDRAISEGAVDGTAYEIREASSDEAPVAVTQPGWNPMINFSWRLFEGKLYRNVFSSHHGSLIANPRPRTALEAHPLACTNRNLLLMVKQFPSLLAGEEGQSGVERRILDHWTRERAKRLLVVNGTLWQQDLGPSLNLHGISRVEIRWTSPPGSYSGSDGFFGPDTHIRYLSFAESEDVTERLSDALKKRVHGELERNRPELSMPVPRLEMQQAASRLALSAGLTMASVALMRRPSFEEALPGEAEILQMVKDAWSETRAGFFWGTQINKDEAAAGYRDLSDDDAIDGPIGAEAIPLLEDFCKAYGRPAARWSFLPKLAAARGRIGLLPAPGKAQTNTRMRRAG